MIEPTPKVLNKRTDKIPLSAVYVGRPSKWGNPFVAGEVTSRIEVCKYYRSWIEHQITTGLLDIDELRGKDLVCWCAPLPCHADVLLELANG